MLPINCDVVGILIKRHASPFVNDTSNYQKKTDMYFFMDPLMFFHESISISIIFLSGII